MYLACRGLYKQAGDPLSEIGSAALEPIKSVFKIPGEVARTVVTELVKNYMDATKTAAVVTAPAAGILMAYLAARAQEPKATAENATEYAQNALELQSLAQSKLDLKNMKLQKELKSSRKAHDQFL